MQILQAYQEYLKYILALILSDLLIIYITPQLFPSLFFKIVNMLLFTNLLFLFSIPVLYYYKIRHEIEKNYPFFIAFLYAISDISSSRKRVFELAGEAKEFGYIAKVMKKIVKLAINYRLGFAEATKQVSRIVPEGSLKQFLDRFSSALEAGEDLTEYLDKEFNMALDLYEVQYKKSLENIRTLQDLAVSFMVSLGFGIVLVMIIPIIIGGDILLMTGYFLIVFIASNILAYLLSKYLVLDDPLIHDLPDKPKQYKNVQILFVSLLPLSLVMYLLISKKFPDLPLLMKLAISLSPLAYVSFQEILFEREVKAKEKIFISFMNVLSGVMAIKIGSQAKAIDSVRVHDFKGLNRHIDNLYKRIVLTYDFMRSWYYFAAEIGSRLIARSILIFSRAVELGGDPEKIGKKIVSLVEKVLDMRKLKEQFLSSSRGMFYGGYIGFVAILYVSIEIVSLLQNLFSGLSDMIGGDVMSMIGFSLFNFSVDITLLRAIIDFMAVFQAFIMALIIKNIDGGSKYGVFLELLILLWAAALISIGVHKFFTQFLSQV